MDQPSASSWLALTPLAKPAPPPRFIPPSLAALRAAVPNGSGFLHELKLDGYRIQAHLRDGRAKLYTRSGHDWTNRFATITTDVARLQASNLVLDGEIIAAEPDGRPNFSALQDDLKRGRHDRFVYYAFDLLHFDGHDTRPAPLIERKRVLQLILAAAGTVAPRVLYSEHFEDGAALYDHAGALGLEGIVSKRMHAPYRSGRSERWFKVKCWKRGRFVVVGYVPEGSSGLLKLRLARREGAALVYAGRVGSGWDREGAREIRRSLEPLVRSTAALTKPLKKVGTTWVQPSFDADITYADITDDGMVRHPVFKALVPCASS